MIDTRISIPEATEYEHRFIKNEKALARDRVSVDAKRVRAFWEEKRITEMLAQSDASDSEARDLARQTAINALESGVLAGDFVIHVQEEQQCVPVKVSAVLAEPARYHERRCLDPLEPEYDGRRPVGILYPCQSRPTLFSHAHGGASYKLQRTKHRVELVAGQESEAVKKTIGHLANEPMVFIFDDGLATVRNGNIHRFDEYTLKHFLSNVVQLYRNKTSGGKTTQIDASPTDAFLKEVLGNANLYDLKPLDAVITAPILRLDGSLLDRPGYDEKSRLFLALSPGADIRIPSEPTLHEISEALEFLWAPFRGFPFVDEDAKGAALAALLTAAVRAILPTSPAFGYDAPTQGSGKSLLARSVAAIATGEAPLEVPPASRCDDNENRKRLVPIVMNGSRAFILDNVVGEFDSPSMAMFLTSPTFSDRELGHSRFACAVNRTLFLITGNNLRFTGDMTRRVIPCRIDPGTENPITRQFDLDPYAYVLEHRLELIAAALTVMRGRYVHMTERAPGRLASFEAWDAMVRQTVGWVSRQVVPGHFGDPVDLVLKMQNNDPVREAEAALFSALFAEFGEREFTATEVSSPRCFLIHTTLEDLAGDRATRSARSIGKNLGYRLDRVRDGLKLVARRPSRKEALRYRIFEVET